MPRPASVKPRQRGPKRASNKDAPTSREVDTSEVVVEISELGNFRESTNILLHGPVGHGKTVYAAGLGKRAVFLGSDRGVVSAKHIGSEARIIRAPDWPHFVAGVELADKELTDEDWLIVDTHNKAQRMFIRWYLGVIHEENESRDLDIPALQDHQKWQNAFMRWTDHLIEAQYNTVLICNSMTRMNSDGDEMVMPLIAGGRNNDVCEYVMAQVDVIQYLQIASKLSTKDNTVRRVFSQPYTHPDTEKTYVAKDHYGVLPAWEDIDQDDLTAMADFAEMIRG